MLITEPWHLVFKECGCSQQNKVHRQHKQMRQMPYFESSSEFLINTMDYKYCFQLLQVYAKFISSNFSVTEYSQHIHYFHVIPCK